MSATQPVTSSQTATPAPSPATRTWSGLVALGLAGALALAGLYVVYGQVNPDEGWYVLAARAVFDGALPYQDFAFTQAPLLPYVYGLPELVATHDLLVARVVSAGFGLAAIGLAVRLAWRVGSRWAAAATAVLLALNPFTLAYLSLAKTYALTALLISASVATLAIGTRPARTGRLAAGAALASAAAATRLSMLPFAVLLVGLAVWSARRDRRAVGGVLLAAGAPAALTGAVVAADPGAALFNLVFFHQMSAFGDGTWGDLSLIQKAGEYLTGRLPIGALHYRVYTVLVLAALALGTSSRRVRRRFATTPALSAAAAGVGLFVAAHAGTGVFHSEYFTPVVPLAVALVAVAADAVASPHAATAETGAARRPPSSRLESPAGLAALAVTAAAVLAFPVGGSLLPRLATTSPTPLTGVERLADFVAAHTRPGEPVLALSAQSVAVEADRPLVAGLSLGQFSYADVSTARARRFALVNAERLTELLRRRRPAAVVLTGDDREILTRRGALVDAPVTSPSVISALQAGYTKARAVQDFHRPGQRASVWLPRRASSSSGATGPSQVRTSGA